MRRSDRQQIGRQLARKAFWTFIIRGFCGATEFDWSEYALPEIHIRAWVCRCYTTHSMSNLAWRGQLCWLELVNGPVPIFFTAMISTCTGIWIFPTHSCDRTACCTYSTSPSFLLRIQSSIFPTELKPQLTDVEIVISTLESAFKLTSASTTNHDCLRRCGRHAFLVSCWLPSPSKHRQRKRR